MGRPRHHDKGLPKRWSYRSGAYYYRVPEGLESHWDGMKWFKLGYSYDEAMSEWENRVLVNDRAVTMGDLFDKFLSKHTPKLAPKTQRNHRRAIKKLRSVFDDFNIVDFETQWAFEYYDRRSKVSVAEANLEIRVLSACFNKAIEWGDIKHFMHPIRGLRIKKADPKRDRYVEDWEIIEALKVAPDLVKYYIFLVLLTGMDVGTICSIKKSDLTDKGILARRKKTQGRKRLYPWSQELRLVVDRIVQMRPKGEYLMVSKTGAPYLKENGEISGFDSIWRRFMAKALAETELKERFTRHDLRAKVASDLDSAEVAQTVLDHADPSITRSVYRRRVAEVPETNLGDEIMDKLYGLI